MEGAERWIPDRRFAPSGMTTAKESISRKSYDTDRSLKGDPYLCCGAIASGP